MKKVLKSLLGLVVVVLVIYGCNRPDSKLRLETEKLRQELRQAGFRTELTDFQLTSSDVVRRRTDAVIAGGNSFAESQSIGQLKLMEPVGTNVAFHIVPVEKIDPVSFDGRDQPGQNLWVLLDDEFGKHRIELDAACHALLDGNIQFELQIKDGSLLLPHLSFMKRLAGALSERAVLDLHQHRPDKAFTNLLAFSRLINAWQPEPMDISHLVRFACIHVVRRALWETTQTPGLNESQYLVLQMEWEALRIFDQLADTVALSRASAVAVCRLRRIETFADQAGPWSDALGQAGRMLFTSPLQSGKGLWQRILASREFAGYQNVGTYEDEKALLTCFRDRESEIKRALLCTNWMQMRAMPGVTNRAVFPTGQFSRIGLLLHQQQLGLSFHSEDRTLLARAAEAEALRRVIVTAIALERYFLQHSNYPAALGVLVPKYLAALPVDFIDGQDLRYRLKADGRFILYSVGLDGVDNGGQNVTERFLFRQISSRRDGQAVRPKDHTDIVWPMPASGLEVDRYNKVIEEENARVEAQMKEREESGFQMNPETGKEFRARYGVPWPGDNDEVSTNQPPQQ